MIDRVASSNSPRFALLPANRALRLPRNSRTGDDAEIGVFQLIEQTLAALFGYLLDTNRELVPLASHMVTADDRVAIMRATYIVRTT